jgi:predicted acylesterase/phospholipase RssA
MNATKLLPDLLRKDNGSRAKSRNGHPVETALKRKRAENRHSKVALVLAGGGIMGVVYEIGALRAINDMLVDLSVNDFDIYVGTSAGALITALIANGFTPHEIMQFMDNRHPEIGGVRVGDVFHANLQDYGRRLMNLPRALLTLGYNSIRRPGDLALSDIIWEFTEILPSGLYDGNALERYVRKILDTPGRSNRFDFLEKQLYIVATELDTGNRAVFGQGGKAIVPISRAVAASSAVPVLYRPVQIFGRDYLDGGLHGTASLDLAIEAGAKLVICINPMVPLNARRVHPDENYISEHGLPAIINQAVRTLLHSSLRYHIKNLQVKYPDVDIVLIQPEWDDQRMFSYNPMYYGSRLMLAEHGFETVTSGLLSHYDYYRQVLKRHGIEVHTDFVQRELAAMQRSGNDPRVVREIIEAEEEGFPVLASSLDRLEANLARLDKSIG